MKRLRRIFESIAYAGLKPAASSTPTPRMRWLGPLRGPLERFLNGSASSDPLYLTNRTLGQKARLWILVGLPFLAVLWLVYHAARGDFDDESQLPRETKSLTNAEIAAKMLPDLNKPITLESNKKVEVVDVIVRKGSASEVAGTAKNTASEAVSDVEIVFDLADDAGSRLGAVTCKIPRIEPNSTAPFQLAIPQHNAAFALVREIHNQ